MNRKEYFLLNFLGLLGIITMYLVGDKFPGWAGSTFGTMVGMISLVVYLFPIYYANRLTTYNQEKMK